MEVFGTCFSVVWLWFNQQFQVLVYFSFSVTICITTL
uniref:Uncharacterized protein n=1 Tax=Rhizophora mucronata TaxID=61149 RepID=A0A2P2N3Q9_RHIMU